MSDLESLESKVQKLQMALQAKAKAEPKFRFYQLYDKVYRMDVLTTAYMRCKANGGVAGVDGQTFKDIKDYGEEKWLGELAQELRHKMYQPAAVKRVWIPKPNGKKRPLGIPTIRDRVVQTATMMVIEPIFEVDLQPEQFAYRPERGALDAIKAIHSLINTGHTNIIEGDLADYFGSIPHQELMKSVARRIVDKHVLQLIKMWLIVPVEETDDKGNQTRTTPGKDTKKGTPQGAPISPLLSNIYMRRFILGWKNLCLRKRWKAAIVNYADDFVICCRGHADEAMISMRNIMDKIGLTVNDEKTLLCKLPEERFAFLGYTIGVCYSPKDGHSYYGTRPSKKSVQRAVEKISAITSPKTHSLDAVMVVQKLNQVLEGWGNYFKLGQVSPAYQIIDKHTHKRLRRWLCAKHKIDSQGWKQFSADHIYEELGLKQLWKTTRNLPWAKA